MVVSLLLLAPLATPVAAQTFQGRVLDQENDEPLAVSVVRLLTEDGDPLEQAITDSLGFYQIRAPEPGRYKLTADRIGFQAVESPVFEVQAPDGVYGVDLTMHAAPVEISGLTITTDRVSDARADRQVQLRIGVSPSSLRYDPIGFDEIQRHVWSDRSIAEAVRLTALPGLIVTQTIDGPCFSLRSRRCLPVYFNDVLLRRTFVEDLPLETVYRIIVVAPSDGSFTYPSGAVLLYTEAWLR